METKRLMIRQPRPEDVDDYLEFRNSEFVLRYNAMREVSREDAQREFSQEKDDSFVLELKQTGKVIGMICVDEDSLRWGVSSREVSYFLNEAFARQGYMKEALAAVVDHLFTEGNLHCVAARSFAPNIASQKLLETLGFHRDGVIPRCVKGYGDVIFDDTLYSVLKEEWKP